MIDEDAILFTVGIALENTIEGLTETEQRVFERMGQGLTNIEIAEGLGIDSPRTVETHKQNVRKAFGLSSMHALLYHAMTYHHFGRFNLIVDKERFIE